MGDSNILMDSNGFFPIKNGIYSFLVFNHVMMNILILMGSSLFRLQHSFS